MYKPKANGNERQWTFQGSQSLDSGEGGPKEAFAGGTDSQFTTAYTFLWYSFTKCLFLSALLCLCPIERLHEMSIVAAL